MSIPSSWTRFEAVQDPETIAQSRNDILLAICAQTDSGNSKPFTAAPTFLFDILQEQ